MKGKKALLPLIFYAVSLFGTGCATHMAKKDSLEEVLKEEVLYQSKNFEERSKDTVKDSIVIHGTGKPNYIKDWKKRPYDNLIACIKNIETTGFSYHVVIGRDGKDILTVPIDKKALHAGPSRTKDGRFNANEFSVGLAIIGPYWRDVTNKKNGKSGYTHVQYMKLAKWCVDLYEKGITHIYFHEEISGREFVKWGIRDKSKVGDPGIYNGAFDMAEFMECYRYCWNEKYGDGDIRGD